MNMSLFPTAIKGQGEYRGVWQDIWGGVGDVISGITAPLFGGAAQVVGAVNPGVVQGLLGQGPQQPPAPPAPPPSAWDKFTKWVTDNSTPILIGAGVLVLTVVGYFIFRKRRPQFRFRRPFRRRS